MKKKYFLIVGILLLLIVGGYFGVQKFLGNKGKNVVEKEVQVKKNNSEKEKWDIPEKVTKYNPFKKHLKEIEDDSSLTFIEDINVSTKSFIPQNIATSYILNDNNQISSIIVVYDSNFKIIYESDVYNGYNFNHISASPNKNYIALFSDVIYDDGEDPISSAEILFIDFQGEPIDIPEKVKKTFPKAPGKFNEQDIYIYNNNVLFIFDIDSKCYWFGDNKNPVKVEIYNNKVTLLNSNINLDISLEKNCY